MKVLHPSRVKSTELMNSAESAWLIVECITGNETAIEALIHQYEAGVFRLALSIVGDTADANEITQETFISALRSLSSYQEKKSFRAWLYTIALNLSRSHLRKRKVIERVKDAVTTLFKIDSQKQILPEEKVIQNEKESTVWNELHEMDERHRTVVILRYFHELSIAEIAEILNISEGTIHSRLYTARERLRQSLSGLMENR